MNKRDRMDVWIIGGGKFGWQAAQALYKKGFSVTLVDPDAGALEKNELPGLETLCEEGVSFLFDRMRPDEAPEWVVPAVPVHLAFEWVRRRVGAGRILRRALPEPVACGLPNAMAGDSGDVYVSHADFICPSGCSEPDGFCTMTRETRKEDMFRILERTGTPVLKGFVIQSHQLAPGVGGYRPGVLFEMACRLGRHEGGCFVATACRCHGVISAAVVAP